MVVHSPPHCESCTCPVPGQKPKHDTYKHLDAGAFGTFVSGCPRCESDRADKIDEWHDGQGAGQQLHEYLGLTWEDYAAWVEQ